jgi:two-component system CheB/CheR fusion protein
VEAALDGARRERTEFRSTYRVVWPDGTVHWVEGRGRFLYDDGGEAYRGIGVILDIDARKRLEADLQEADRRKDEFLGMLAHELRNPLVPIRNAVQVLRLRGHDDPALAQARAMIDRQVAHMARLLDDLLDVARITRGKIALRKEPVLLADLVHQAIEDVRPLVEPHGHALAVSVAPEPIWLDADAVRLTQVIVNLLHNAAKYTGADGRITLSAGREGADAVIRVCDTGIGLEPDLVPRLFGVFVQGATSLDRSHGGLGVGLALVRALVELHGGRVEAHSAGAGRGSEFVVILPAGPPALPLVPRPAAPAVAVAGGLRVLVVEDNVDVAESLRMVLELDGHTVAVAHAGLQALERARDETPDVAFIDIGLPGMDGYELVRCLRRLPTLEATVLVALSGYGRSEDKERATAAGFDHHLTKPVDPAHLTELLAAIVREPDQGLRRGLELARAR